MALEPPAQARGLLAQRRRLIEALTMRPPAMALYEIDLEPAELALRRRRQRVVVAAADAPPKPQLQGFPEKRARLTTLPGLGAREALPTLPDWDSPHPGACAVEAEAPTPRADAVDSSFELAELGG